MTINEKIKWLLSFAHACVGIPVFIIGDYCLPPPSVVDAYKSPLYRERERKRAIIRHHARRRRQRRYFLLCERARWFFLHFIFFFATDAISRTDFNSPLRIFRDLYARFILFFITPLCASASAYFRYKPHFTFRGVVVFGLTSQCTNVTPSRASGGVRRRWRVRGARGFSRERHHECRTTNDGEGATWAEMANNF